MIVVECPYCNSFVKDETGDNFQYKNDYDIISCSNCCMKISLMQTSDGERREPYYNEEYNDYDDGSYGIVIDFEAIKADCLNNPKIKDNHVFKGDKNCLICKKDFKPLCHKLNGNHKFDKITHICIYCNSVRDPKFVPCEQGGKSHVFIDHLCFCMKKDNFSNDDKLKAQERSLNIKKAIGSLGETMNFNSDEYKSSTAVLFDQIRKIDKFLEANK